MDTAGVVHVVSCWQVVLWVSLVAWAVVVTVWDLCYRRIPNWLNTCGVIVLIGWVAVVRPRGDIDDRSTLGVLVETVGAVVLPALVAFTVYVIAFLAGQMGGGDVKCAFVCGGWIGLCTDSMSASSTAWSVMVPLAAWLALAQILTLGIFLALIVARAGCSRFGAPRVRAATTQVFSSRICAPHGPAMVGGVMIVAGVLFTLAP